MEELEHILRRTRTSKLKDETKINYLRRELGPEVEKWLSDLPLTEEFNMEPGGRKLLDVTQLQRKISVSNAVNR